MIDDDDDGDDDDDDLAPCYQSKFHVLALQVSPICSGNFTFLHCLGLIDMLLANKNTESFECVLLYLTWRVILGG